MLITIHIFSIILIMQIVKRGLDGLLTGAEGREQATCAGHGGAADSRTRTRSVGCGRLHAQRGADAWGVLWPFSVTRCVDRRRARTGRDARGETRDGAR